MVVPVSNEGQPEMKIDSIIKSDSVKYIIFTSSNNLEDDSSVYRLWSDKWKCYSYYFKDIKTKIYQNQTYTSQTLALSGESKNGHHNKGKYYLTNNKKEVEYYQEKA